MNKAVLISIQPKWCSLIASGEKTVEVRKTKPKLKTPFKVYIYCTKAKEILLDVLKDGDDVCGCTYTGKTVFIKGTDGSVCDMYGKRQKVIGEFVCDRFIPIEYGDGVYYSADEQGGYSRMTVKQAVEYGKGKPLYAWHISDLVIYDEPKELSKFQKAPATDHCGWGECDLCKYGRFDETDGWICKNVITRPPQSWCYVEELK